MDIHCVSFSGGKDSTAMLLMMLEKGMRIDRIIFVDTTKEFPELYKHIEKVQSVCPVKIETTSFDFDYFFADYIKIKGKRKGEAGYGWADFHNRWCTMKKVEAFHRALGEIKKEDRVIEYHGIAFDEKKRVKKGTKRRELKYPLVDWEITEKQALSYCYSKGFDWDGLYEKYTRVSCWCCPMQRLKHLETIYNERPELWSQLVEMDKKSFRQFKEKYSVADLEKKFSKKNQLPGE